MRIHNDAATGGGTMPPPVATPTDAPMVPVWDPLVRAFHWSLVGLFVIAYASGEEMDGLHQVAGYAILALLLLRVLWGFIGTPHALFRNFVRSPRDVLDYLKLTRQHRAPRYLGHNPAGGAMAIALMGLLGGICLTGHLMTTTAGFGSEVMEGLHSLLADVAIGLIGLHLIGNLLSSAQHGDNLVRSMITGTKRGQ
jgi:cytochrome b